MSEKKSKAIEKKSQAIVKAKDEVIEIRDCLPTDTSLEINPDISIERLEILGEKLLKLKRRTLQFWLGDWCNFCEDNSRALSQLESFYSDRSIKNIAWVCRQVEDTRRRANLSFAHHQTIAPLPPEEQESWLEEAEHMGWAVKELRRRISEWRLDSIKEEYEKGKNDEKFIFISTKDRGYSYPEYISLLNSSVKKLTRRIYALEGEKLYFTIEPQYCKSDEDREFTSNCARLFWSLEQLLGEHLSKLTLLRYNKNSTDPKYVPLLLTELWDGGYVWLNPDLHRYIDFWEFPKQEPGIFRFHSYFAICHTIIQMLNTEVRHLIKQSKDYFSNYYESGCEEYIEDKKEFIKKQVDRFKYKSYALILHLIDLSRLFDEHVSNSVAKDTVEKMKEQLFDSDTDGEEKKSQVDAKVKELLNIVFEDAGKD